MTLYRCLDSAALQNAYDNTKVVPDFAKTLGEMQNRAKATYEKFSNCQRNIAYGALKRNTFDYFPANTGQKAPLYIFIHGGYWHACTKEDFAYVAQGPLALGYHVILIEYTLTPEVTMTHLVGEVRQALDYIDANTEKLKIDRSKVCLSGHSAGGHLTAMHRDHPLISYALPISPLVDMLPMKLCWLNEMLSLTDQEVEALSPLYHMKKGVPTDVLVGGDELPGLLSHGHEYYVALKAIGNETFYIQPKGLTHFTILDTIASPSSEVKAVLQKHLGL